MIQHCDVANLFLNRVYSHLNLFLICDVALEVESYSAFILHLLGSCFLIGSLNIDANYCRVQVTEFEREFATEAAG